MNRRDALKVIGGGAALLAVPTVAAVELLAPEAKMETYTYKTAGGCAIKADVYSAGKAMAPRPVVVMIHGGALIMGARYPAPMELIEPLTAKGCAVVSIDYRLAPETKLPEIIADVQDAFRWVRESGPGLFNADPARIGVQGGSAGGYLTLMTGFCISPRPKALVSFYGYGDLVGDWYSKPDAYYSKQTAVSKADAYSAVGDGVPCGNPQGRRRGDFYLYCRQNGLWAKEVAGWDPIAEADKFHDYCPVQNVTKEYPPTLLAHGDNDTDVPYAQSVLMDATLTKAGVEHEFVTLTGAGHGFSHAAPGDYQKINERAIAFLLKYLSA